MFLSKLTALLHASTGQTSARTFWQETVTFPTSGS